MTEQACCPKQYFGHFINYLRRHWNITLKCHSIFYNLSKNNTKSKASMKSEGALYNVHLNAARGFAALIVFAGHGRDFFLDSIRAAVGLGATTESHAIVSAAHAPSTNVGHQAVIIFFVLSGYLVGGGVIRALRKSTWSWKYYTLQRLTRLWTVLLPALLLTLALDALGRYFSGPNSIYSHRNELAEISGTLDPATFVGNLLFVQTILVDTFGTNGPLWSLANEFWYYVMFPLVVFAILSDSVIHRLATVMILGLIIYFIGFQITLYFVIWLMGAALEFPPRCRCRRAAQFGTYGSVFVFIVANVLLLKYPINLFASDLILAALFSICCYFILHATERATTNLYFVCSAFLSEMSYTLYLVHTPLLVFLSAILVGSWKRWPLDFLHICQFVAICLFVFSVAYGVYFCFERNTGKVRAWVQRIVRLKVTPI